MEQGIVMDVLLSVVSALLGFFLRSIWVAVRDLQEQDAALTDKLARVEVLVAGEYVRKNDFDRKIDAIFGKLDRIEEKLDRKADKERS